MFRQRIKKIRKEKGELSKKNET
nr:hypothetical protein [Candidatus Arsenophonus triatominarum]